MSTCPTCGTKYGPNVHLCTHDGTVLEEDGSPEQQQVGKVLAGKYRLDAPLSHGGMGVVYKATHVMLNKPVAVKLIKSDLAVSPEIARRFQREARAASNLNHPNIVAVYDLGQTEDGTLYIAMELVNGPSLKDVIKTGGAMDTPRIVRILRPVASALSLAHRHGIIHRDLKPQNIMLADAGDGTEVPKLLDFGIAKTFDEATAQLTATGFALGTPQYMSPEQALGREVDARADIYSFGIILYEMLVGDVPFTDQSTAAILVKQVNERPARPSSRRAEVSPALEAIALRCMEKDPANRFQSADEAIAALDAAGGAAPGAAATAATSGGAFDATLPASSATVVLPQSTQPFGSTAANTAAATQAAQAGDQASAPPAVPPLPATAAAATVPQAPAAQSAASTHPTVPMTPEARPQPPLPTAGKPATAVAKPAGGRGPILVLAAAVLVLVAVGVGAWRLGYLPLGAGQVAQSNLVAGPPPSGTPATGTPQAPAAAAQPPGTPAAQTPATETPQAPPENPPATEQPVVPPGASSAVADANPPATEPSARGAEAPVVTAPTARAQSERRTGGARLPRAKTSPASPSRAAASGGAMAEPGASSARAGRLAEGAGQAPAAARETAAALPEHPAVFLRCSGPQEICSAARATFTQAMHRTGMLPAPSPGSADVVLQITAAVVDERSEEAYGASFMVRTYSLDVDGNATKFREPITMPEPRTFSFDSRYASQRAMDNTRASANAAIDSVREYWAKKK